MMLPSPAMPLAFYSCDIHTRFTMLTSVQQTLTLKRRGGSAEEDSNLRPFDVQPSGYARSNYVFIGGQRSKQERSETPDSKLTLAPVLIVVQALCLPYHAAK
jgi:hypothetical protein